MKSISATKREANRRRREEAAPAWRQFWFQKRCFWTWPFGHAYDYRNTGGRCQACGKQHPIIIDM